MGSIEKPTIGTAEAAEILGRDKNTISRWCREKKFPNAYQKAQGHPWHIPKEDIEEFQKTKNQIKISKSSF